VRSGYARFYCIGNLITGLECAKLKAKTPYEKSEPERDRRKFISSARKDILLSQTLMSLRMKWTEHQSCMNSWLTGSNEDKWTVFVAGSDKPPDVMLPPREDSYPQGEVHSIL